MFENEPNRLLAENFIKGADGSKENSFKIRKKILKDYDIHWHDYFEIEMLVDGSAIHILNGKSYTLSKGDIYLLSPIDFHEIHPTSPGTTVMNIMFTEDLISDELLFFFFNSNENIIGHLNEKEYNFLYTIIDRAISEYAEKQLFSQNMVRNIIECIFITLGRKFNLVSEKTTSDLSTMHKVLMHIHHHFREDPSLEETAIVAGLNPGYFSSVFHQFTGKTYKKYLTELKMNYAKKLLLSGNLSVTEICYNSGYNTLSHFLREFKKYYGTTPAEMRK